MMNPLPNGISSLKNALSHYRKNRIQILLFDVYPKKSNRAYHYAPMLDLLLKLEFLLKFHPVFWDDSKGEDNFF
jgi:hypothetical protein